MTDYPSIKPEDVREGDVVEVVHQLTVGWQLARTLPHLTDDCYVAGEPVPVTQLRLVSRPTPPEPLCPFSMGETVFVKGAPQPLTVAGWNYYAAWGKWMVRCEDGAGGYRLHLPMELTSSPPEPPLRVGDWVRDLSGSEGQITVITDYPDHSPYCVNGQWREGHNLTRIEPPVGWPVGVPDGDAPGGVRWWVRDPGGEYRGRHDGQNGYLEWSDLVAAGGVPALAVTR